MLAGQASCLYFEGQLSRWKNKAPWCVCQQARLRVSGDGPFALQHYVPELTGHCDIPFKYAYSFFY